MLIPNRYPGGPASRRYEREAKELEDSNEWLTYVIYIPKRGVNTVFVFCGSFLELGLHHAGTVGS